MSIESPRCEGYVVRPRTNPNLSTASLVEGIYLETVVLCWWKHEASPEGFDLIAS
jgi:hypothetical protein